MWLVHYLGPPTQSLGSLYKAGFSREGRRSPTVVRQFRATRTMRKTRLVILPGVRSITQIGCLLLFLACPTIAFKGQEKRDVEPICKVHELKYWWLPFDTGEGESSLRQTWTGFDCQRDDSGIMKGKDNATDSIAHFYDENMISHGHAAIHGQDASYNLKTNFVKEKRWLIHSPSSPMKTDTSARRNAISQIRTTGRSEIRHVEHKTERISSASLERKVVSDKDQRIRTDKQTSSTRKMVSNRLLRDSREGSLTRRVDERRRSIPISIRLPSRMIPEITFRYRTDLERNAVLKRNDESQRVSSEQKDLSKILARQENNERSTHISNSFSRLFTRIRVTREIQNREERLSNDVRRVSSGRREAIFERTTSQHDILQRTKRSDKRIPASTASESTRLDRRISGNNSAQQRRQRSSAFFEQRENEPRSTYSDVRNEQYRMNKRLERAAFIDNEQRLADSRSLRHESRVLSLNRQTTEPNIQREILRERENRETTQTSLFVKIKPKYLEERSRMNRRIERAATLDNGLRLSERRLGRSIESQVVFPERRMIETNSQRNIRIHEKENAHRIRSGILRESRYGIRENVPPTQNTLRRLSLREHLGDRQTIQRSAFTIVQPRDFEERYRMNRRHERTLVNDEEKLSEDRQSRRSVESNLISRDRRMAELNLRNDIKTNNYVRTGRIRTQMLRNTRNENRENILPRQNTLRRQTSLACLERREMILKSAVAVDQDRRIECATPFGETQRLSDVRSRSVESRKFSLQKRTSESNLQVNIRIHGKDPTHIIKSEILRESRTRENVLPLYQNTLRRDSPSSYQERREKIHLSRFAITQPKDPKEQSRVDRKLQSAVYIDNVRRLSDRRSARPADSRVFVFDRRTDDSHLRTEIRQITKDSRYGIRENVFPPQNVLQRQSTSARMEHREIINRSAFELIQPRRTRIDRRLERAADRRSERSVEPRLSSSDRSMTDFFVLRVGGKRENLGNRRIRSEILRDMRNEISENIVLRNTLLRQRSSTRLGRREMPQLSRFAITQPKDFVELSRMDRKLHSAVFEDKERRFSGRSASPADSRIVVSNRRMDESNLGTNIKIMEIENTRRFESDTLRNSQYRKRENVFPQQNIIQRQNTPERVERREIIKRSAISIIRPEDSEDRFKPERRLQRAASIDREQRSFERRSERSAVSRAFSFDRRMDQLNLRSDGRIYEKQINRERRSETLRESRIGIRRQSSLERRETFRRSLQFAIISREDFERRSNVERTVSIDREQHSPGRVRAQHSAESRRFSFGRRMAELNLRRDIGEHEEVITRRIRSDIFRDTRYGNRENILPQRNTIRRHNSPSNLEHREKTHQSRFPITQANDPESLSRIDRSAASIVKEQSLSDGRSERSAESRVFSFERRMDQLNLRRDVRIYEKQINRERRSEMLRESRIEIRRQSSLERRETFRRSLRLAINPPNFYKLQEERRENKVLDKENYLFRRSDRRSTTVLTDKKSFRFEGITEFTRTRRDIRDITTNNKEGVRSQPRIITNAQRREHHDSLKTSKMQETDVYKKHMSSENRQMRDERMIPIVKMRRDMNHKKQSVPSSSRRDMSPATYTSYPEPKTSHTGHKVQSSQKPISPHKTVIAATMSGESRSELNLGNVIVKSQIQEESQVFNAHKGTRFFHSWIDKVISAIKMAVTGSAADENILNLSNDSGLTGNKYLTGHEHHISKLLPFFEKSNDKGHLLQDFVLGSVVAGYFISSIHLKTRDYRNFIRIF